MMANRSVLIGLSLGLVMFGCRSQPIEPQSTEVQPGDTITILGTLTGVGEDKLRQAMAPFTEATGVEVIYEGTDAFTTLVPVRVDSGNPPDIALFPQPGLMLDFAEAGQMVPLTDFIERSTLTEAYDEYLLDLVSRDDAVYGLWMRADVKSLVWYSPNAFAAKGYTVPTTWAELEALSDRDHRRRRHALVHGHGKRAGHRLGGDRLGRRYPVAAGGASGVRPVGHPPNSLH